ncbi:MAG: glycosyltransferase [Gammaproteobacteria bacterium]|nr:glycosyltransferase [Gammaproteobacteria bacterium]
MRLQQTVEVATLDSPAASWRQGWPCPVHCLGPGLLKYGYTPRFPRWLRQNLARFDAVVIHGIWQYHSLATWTILRRSSVPYYLFTNGMLDPWFKQRYPLKHLKKLLYWAAVEHRVLRDAHGVLFTSEEERLLARQSFSLYRANEIVVNFGIAGLAGDAGAQRAQFLQRFPHLRGKRCFLFVSRLDPKKGCDLLIEALAPLLQADPALQLVIAGPDKSGQQQQLANLAEQLGVTQSITWAGWLSEELKVGAFQAAEAFVLPSHQENFGMVVAEALSVPLPVLISNKVNIWREIAADNAGLVAEDTVEGTRHMLQRWLALSEQERQAMGRNAADCFRQRFHIDTGGRNILQLFGQHARNPHPSAAA